MGLDMVTLVFGTMLTMVELYLTVPEPSVVNGNAAPPNVLAT